MLNKKNSTSEPALKTQDERFRLTGKPLKDWWQIGDMNRVFRRLGEPLDKYQNPIIRAALLFILVLPFHCAILLKTVGLQGIKLIMLASLAAVALFIQMAIAYRQHCKIVVEVMIVDSGMRLKSPIMLDRTVQWIEIADFFEIQNGDYVLLTTRAEDFVLSCDLTNSATLFEKIRSRCPQHKEKFHTNVRLPNSFVDGANGACLAIGIACTFPILSAAAYGVQVKADSFLIAAIGMLVAIVMWRIHVTKLAELVRIGDSTIAIHTRSGVVHMRREDIRRIRKLGGLYLIHSSKGTFWTLIDKKETATAKLLEFRQQLITARQFN